MKKLLTILVTVVLLFNVVAVSAINAAAHQPDPPIKLYNYIDTYTTEELAELTADSDDYYVSVFVAFQYTKLDTRELDELEKSTRLDLIRNYYGTRNLLLANELGIPTDTVSLYTPFAELSYATLAEYEQNENFIYGLAESVDVAFVEISIKKAETHGTQVTGDPNDEYDTATVFAHTGITDHTYTGDGIKIGFVEKSTFQGANYILGSLTQNGGFIESEARYHAYHVLSVALGSQGIAFDADCYVSSLANSTWRAALEWLINNNVDVINVSVGEINPTGRYTQLTAYIDYLVDTTDTLVITAAGEGASTSDSFLRSPSVAANALTIAAINPNKEVLDYTRHTSYTTANSNSSYTALAKPDMVAPGFNITMVPNATATLTGSSYSAAIVTGIAARLLEEYPSLKNNAHLLKAVLSASCVTLPSGTFGQDSISGAGLINYSHARTIMQNHQYEIFEKPYDEEGGLYLGYFSMEEAAEGSTILMRYVIPVSGTYRSAPSADQPVTMESFSSFYVAFDNFGTSNLMPGIDYTFKNTGFFDCPTDPDGTVLYNVDVYLDQNNSYTEYEDIIIAYMIY